MPFFPRFTLLLGALIGVCLISSDVQGQGVASPTTREETVPAPLQRAPLDAVVLFNKETGKTVFTLPGSWPLETIDEFSKFVLRGEPDAVPSFTIRQIIAWGNVVGNRVEAVLHFIIMAPGDQTVRIPLSLKEGVLPFSADALTGPNEKEASLPYRYTGPGVFDLIVNPQDGQYIALIRNRDRAKKDLEPPSSVVRIVEDLPEHLLNIDFEPEKLLPETAQDKRVTKETPPEQRHELLLNLWFPLTGLVDEGRRLTISFPRAVSSQFQLSVPIVGATATVVQGSLLDTHPSEDGQSTLFTIHGFRSNFDISWQKKKAERIEERPVLNIQDAVIIARLEHQSTSYDAVLPISSPVAFDRVFVRLPQNAVLDEEGSGGEYTLHELSSDEKTTVKAGAEADSDPTVYEVRFSRKMVSQTVRLRAVQPILPDRAGTFREIEGFHVLGAERQTGSLSVGIPNEMRLNWRPARGLRRVDLPTSPVSDGIDARFEFSMQPFLLRAQIILPQTRVIVRPEYQVQINKGQLRLTARFSCVVRGSPTDKLQFVFPDWRWIDIGSSNIVDDVGIRKDDATNVLTVPLRAPLDGAFEIELTAFQPISLDETTKHRLTVRLPSPNAHWTEPASVVIVPDDNVELIPVADDAASVGLARKSRRTLSTPIRIELPARQQAPLVYQTESAEPVYVTDMIYHRQSVAVSVQNDIQLLEPEDQITATFVYTVAYEPIDGVLLLVPKSIDATGRLNVFHRDEPLEIRDAPLAVGEESSDRWTKKRVSLPPEAMIGTIPLVVRYSIPPISVERDITAVIPIPLIRPAEADVSSVDVNLSVRGGFRVELHDDVDGAWKPVDMSPLEGAASQRQFRSIGFSSLGAQERIPLLLSVEERETLGTTIVEKAWVQTWLTDQIRVDRGVYQLTSDRESITLRLPPAVGKAVLVRLDGVQIPVLPTPKGELIVPLTTEQQLRPVRLDVWYQVVDDSLRSRVQLELPHFEPGAVVRCAYWQLILPQYRHLAGVPAGWTPEYDWRWNGLFWGRTPSLSMDFIGLPDEPTNAPPPDAVQYLFSSLAPPTSVSFYVVNRSLIVLLASGLSLLIGLALIYFPRCRYAGSLFGLGVALVATILYQPAPVLLALQASSLGVFLALGAGYAYRILNRRDRWTPPPRRSIVTWDVSEDVPPPSELPSVIIDESGSKKEESEEK